MDVHNLSVDLQSKSLNWFLYDRDLRHETAKLQEKLGPNFVSNWKHSENVTMPYTHRKYLPVQSQQ